MSQAEKQRMLQTLMKVATAGELVVAAKNNGDDKKWFDSTLLETLFERVMDLEEALQAYYDEFGDFEKEGDDA